MKGVTYAGVVYILLGALGVGAGVEAYRLQGERLRRDNKTNVHKIGRVHGVGNCPRPGNDAGRTKAMGTGQTGRHLLGTFRVTAYCPCAKCCGDWAKYRTCADGRPCDGIISPRSVADLGTNQGSSEYSVAADWSVCPRHSLLAVEGIGKCRVRDTGSAIKGKRLDLLFASHQEAINFGVQYLEVYVND